MSNAPDTAYEIDQDKVVRAVYGLIAAAVDLSNLSEDPFLLPLIKHEYADIELVHFRIEQMLTDLKARR